MAPSRQPRPAEDVSQPPNGNSSRHIQAREKDILHKTLGTTSISKSRKTTTHNPKPPAVATTSTSSSTLQTLNSDSRIITSSSAATTSTTPKPTWKLGPGSSEQRMKWTTMPLTTLNTWRTHLSVRISAPYSTESARLSLEHTDTLGTRLTSMCGPPAERPQARVNVERAVAEAFEYRAVNEDEIVAAFLARGEEGRRIAGRGVGEGGVGVGFGAGRVRRGVRCRSDMLW